MDGFARSILPYFFILPGWIVVSRSRQGLGEWGFYYGQSPHINLYDLWYRISIRYCENSCAILENLRWLISEIFEVLGRFLHVCLKWIALLVPYCSMFSCYLLLYWFSVFLFSDWENMAAYSDNMRMFISKIFATVTSITHGCLGLMNHWGSSLFKVILCGALIIWRYYFMALLRKDSLGGKWLSDWLSTDNEGLIDFLIDLPTYSLTKRPKESAWMTLCPTDLLTEWQNNRPSDRITDRVTE